MSGIVGLVYRDGKPVEPGTIEAMANAMAHRGPDGIRTWRNGEAALGQCTLRCGRIGESESLPDIRGYPSIKVVFDGRIDNRGDLLQLLGIESNTRRPISDGDLLCRAYLKWGRSFVEHIVGVFALAVWDRDKRRLYAFTDHFSVRPLYYYESSKLFALASEIKALMLLKEVSNDINPVSIADHLVIPVVKDTGRTFFKDIRKIKPGWGKLLCVDSLSEIKYWSLSDIDINANYDDGNYYEKFRNIFIDSIDCRRKGVNNVGSMLSGGLDSSSIVCALSEEKSIDNIHTFSAVYRSLHNSKQSDESKYINIVLNKVGRSATPHFIRSDERSPFAEWETLHSKLDEPLSAANMFLFWRAYSIAHRLGIRVMYDGFDGDTTVSHGMGRLYELQAQRKIFQLAWQALGLARTMNESPYHVMRSWIKKPVASFAPVSFLLQLKHRLRSNQTGSTAVAPEDTAPKFRVLTGDLRNEVENYLDPMPEPRPTTDADYHKRSLSEPYMTQILHQWNAVAALAGVELAFPFYDRRLVSYCVRLPADQKLRRGWSRYILRRSMEGILPGDVQWRVEKSDLSHGFDAAVRTHGRLPLEQLRCNKSSRLYNFVSHDFLADAISKYLQGDLKTNSPSDGIRVIRALSLNIWLNSGAWNTG